MVAAQEPRPEPAEFAEFVRAVEPRLLHALVAAYGPITGRDATLDALSWAWEHWSRMVTIENQVGYLYRVGQTAARRNGTRSATPLLQAAPDSGMPEVEPALVPALARLSEQQRTAVVLVHAFGWSQTEVARLFEVNVSTVREHLARGLARLRDAMGVSSGR